MNTHQPQAPRPSHGFHTHTPLPRHRRSADGPALSDLADVIRLASVEPGQRKHGEAWPLLYALRLRALREELRSVREVVGLRLVDASTIYGAIATRDGGVHESLAYTVLSKVESRIDFVRRLTVKQLVTLITGVYRTDLGVFWRRVEVRADLLARATGAYLAALYTGLPSLVVVFPVPVLALVCAQMVETPSAEEVDLAAAVALPQMHSADHGQDQAEQQVVALARDLPPEALHQAATFMATLRQMCGLAQPAIQPAQAAGLPLSWERAFTASASGFPGITPSGLPATLSGGYDQPATIITDLAVPLASEVGDEEELQRLLIRYPGAQEPQVDDGVAVRRRGGRSDRRAGHRGKPDSAAEAG